MSSQLVHHSVSAKRTYNICLFVWQFYDIALHKHFANVKLTFKLKKFSNFPEFIHKKPKTRAKTAENRLVHGFAWNLIRLRFWWTQPTKRMQTKYSRIISINQINVDRMKMFFQNWFHSSLFLCWLEEHFNADS